MDLKSKGKKKKQKAKALPMLLYGRVIVWKKK